MRRSPSRPSATLDPCLPVCSGRGPPAGRVRAQALANVDEGTPDDGPEAPLAGCCAGAPPHPEHTTAQSAKLVSLSIARPPCSLVEAETPARSPAWGDHGNPGSAGPGRFTSP